MDRLVRSWLSKLHAEIHCQILYSRLHHVQNPNYEASSFVMVFRLEELTVFQI
jgi:hypothetical protein